MDKKKIETFKKRLETRQQELRRNVSRTEQDGRSADEDSTQDIADKAANSYNKEFLFHQSNNECIQCGKEINAKRLEAVPWTRNCIECQEKLEQGLLEEAPK